MKKLLILGAGIYQVPLIRKAKEMGLSTIAASCPGPYPGLADADEVWDIDTTDAGLLLTRAAREGIDGVCTTGTDVAIRSLGLLCDALQLPGIGGEAARMLTDKALMKEAFQRGNVSTPSSIRVHTFSEALEAFRSLGGPVMVKAVDSSGSRGITKVTDVSCLESAYARASRVTNKDYLLIEEFLDAHEIGVDGFVEDGELKLLLPHDKFVYTTHGTTLPAGHHFPYRCSDSLKSEIHLQMERVVRVTGMNHCAVNADVLIRDGKAYILEAGGRAGATCIPELISIHCGFDYYEQMIRSALGLPTDFSRRDRVPCMAKLLFTEKSGILTHKDDALLSQLNNRGILASLDYLAGDPVQAVRNGTDRIGQVIMKTDLEKELDDILQKLRKHIEIDGVALDKTWND